MIRHSYQILLVDDDIASLEVLDEVLTRAGYNVVSADTGYEALEIVREAAIDLALLDFNLPDTTGAVLLQQIKRFQPSVPAIIMSANTSQGVKFDVFEAGAYTFISKPIDLPQLLGFVSRALDLGQRSISRHQNSRQDVSTGRNTQTVQVKRLSIFQWIRIIRHK